jgi:uncharacterized protein (TIGR02266 family)
MLIDRSFAELLDQPGNDPSERRAEMRVRFETDVSMGAEGRLLTGLSGDVSMGGMFVATFRPVAPGTRLSLRFRLPTGQVMATGVVRWTRDARPGVVAGMGIEFVGLGDLDRATLKRFCGDRPRFLAYDEIVASALARH